MNSLLSLTLTLLATAALMATISAPLHLPSLLGYLAGGVLLGPSVGKIVQPGDALTFMAELGVVLLLHGDRRQAAG